jgi:hypothetical protein
MKREHGPRHFKKEQLGAYVPKAIQSLTDSAQ